MIWCMWQTWHVAQLTVKRISYLEGELSIRLLLALTIFVFILFPIELILTNEAEYFEVLICEILESLGFFVIIIFLIFIPKV